ncbi:MAG: hypothetical protein LBH82_05145 [Bacteroidales bacterium]|jgi:predicted permease|nr:hypothetical protein [Bacteroidales bacterium]
MNNLLRKDAMGLGVVLGFLLPVVCFGILFAVSFFFAPEGKNYLIKLSSVILVSVFANLFTMRHYLVKLKFDKTGRGILLITFILAIAYFVCYHYFKELMFE